MKTTYNRLAHAKSERIRVGKAHTFRPTQRRQPWEQNILSGTFCILPPQIDRFLACPIFQFLFCLRNKEKERKRQKKNGQRLSSENNKTTKQRQTTLTT
jgi:hypothetical protein